MPKNLIYERRKQLGITQVELAEACGVTYASIMRWETGESKGMISRDKLELLCRALKLDVNDISNMCYSNDDNMSKEILLKTIRASIKEMSIEDLNAVYDFIQYRKKK